MEHKDLGQWSDGVMECCHMASASSPHSNTPTLHSALRRLVVNADDFGRSHSINQAVVRAHREGILTTASLMANGEAAAEAVELARQNPRLGVGLHVSLVCGTSALSPGEIPGLVDARGNFGDYPIAAGFRYFFRPELRRQLEREMAAQFEKFRATGLTLDHVNGHLHFHLHPTIFRILMRHAGARRGGRAAPAAKRPARDWRDRTDVPTPAAGSARRDHG